MGSSRDFSLHRDLVAAYEAEQSFNWLSAAHHYRHALLFLAADHRLHTNLGNALWLADQPNAARAAFEIAVSIAPSEALPLRGLGNALRDLNLFEQAAAAYAKSHHIFNNPLTCWSHSQLLLGLERYCEAYAIAEERLKLDAMQPFRHEPYATAINHPSLRKEATSAPLHLWSEQGFGDTLQYLRWLTVLAQQPNAIVLELENQLVELVKDGLSWLPHPPMVISKPPEGTAAPLINAAQAPLMSLPHYLGGAPLSTTGPYLRNKQWPIKTMPFNLRRIGLVWAAGRKLDDAFTAREYQKRSLPPAILSSLVTGLHGAGALLTNLQVGHDRELPPLLTNLFAEELDPDANFAATAAKICELDLVITVDTAMAHLCGAIGHNGWVLLPWSADPRWLRKRSDSPWYPSLQLWRQPSSGDWQAVINKVVEAVMLSFVRSTEGC